MRASPFSTCTVVISMLLGTVGEAQTTASAKPAARKKAAPETASSLEAQAQKYQQLLSDVDVASDPDVKSAVYTKWVEATCKSKQLKFQQSGLDSGLGAAIYQSCSKRLMANPSAAHVTAAPASDLAAIFAAPSPGNSSFPSEVVLPARWCSDIPKLNFDRTDQPNINDPIEMKPKSKPIDLEKMVKLNATESGGEIYTKSSVYVAYVNRLRYSASLGGVVSVITAPTVDFGQMFTTSPVAQANPKGKSNPPTSTYAFEIKGPDEFEEFSKCYGAIEKTFIEFQTALSLEELSQSTTRLKIGAVLAGLPPLVSTADEARSAADLKTIFPHHESPPFPVQDLRNFKILVNEFIAEYSKLQDWAKGKGEPTAGTYISNRTGASKIADRLDEYIASAGAVEFAAGTAKPGDPAKVADASTTGAKLADTKNPGGTPASGSTRATEVRDYEAVRVYIANWRQIFRTVNGANDDYFIVTFTPACGGFFGNGTSTQMQLSVVDSLNPPVAGAKVTPITLDSVVCQPTITVTNGLGMSFIPSQTPAFLAGVKKDAQGNPVLDSSGNPTIIQTLGYSSQSHISAGYALQANASLWATRQWGFEVYWSVGAMLTASTNGTTTDIITGPSFSFRRRTFFVSPMYDLGLRTVYVSPFQPGMPQGNLTSPPTQQVWKSGLGITITFPLINTNTKTVTSAPGGAKVVAPAPTDEKAPKKAN